MHTAFFRSICQIGIFMVCAQTITHFRPNSSYEKYMKLLVSIMVLIQILQPLSSLFSKGREQSLEARAWQFREQFEIGMDNAMEKALEADKILENMTLLEVQEMLEQQEAEGKQQDTETKQQSTESKQQDIETKQQNTESKQQDTETKQQNAESKQQDIETKQQTTEVEQRETQARQGTGGQSEDTGLPKEMGQEGIPQASWQIEEIKEIEKIEIKAP